MHSATIVDQMKQEHRVETIDERNQLSISAHYAECSVNVFVLPL